MVLREGEELSSYLPFVKLDEGMRYPCEQALRAAGFSVVSATKLDEALIWVDRYCPSTIILEHFAYDANAMELISQSWPNTKIIFLAECDNINSINKNFNFATKPLDYIRLIGKVRGFAT